MIMHLIFPSLSAIIDVGIYEFFRIRGSAGTMRLSMDDLLPSICMRAFMTKKNLVYRVMWRHLKRKNFNTASNFFLITSVTDSGLGLLVTPPRSAPLACSRNESKNVYYSCIFMERKRRARGAKNARWDDVKSGRAVRCGGKRMLNILSDNETETTYRKCHAIKKR